MSNADKIIAVARSQEGYHEGRSDGHWNNKQKYSPDVPGLEWSQNQAWCATFVAWCAQEAGVKTLFPVTASTDLGASWFKKKGQWSEYPAVGAQVFYGHNGDMNHTGLVYKFDDDFIYTIEGNTNESGSREGDGVYLKKRPRRDDYVQGYGYPKYTDGIVSADPKSPVKARAMKPAPSKPKPSSGLAKADNMDPKSYRMNRKNTAVKWLKERLVAHGHKTGLNLNDPTYGAGTKAQVRAFQRKQGWGGKDADGMPGVETLKRLKAAPPKRRPVVTVRNK